GLVKPVSVVQGVAGFVTQVHHDLARIFQIVDFLFEAGQARGGEGERNADHRLAGGTYPFVPKIERKPEFLQGFAIKLAVESEHQAVQRGPLELQAQLTNGLIQDSLDVAWRFFEEVQFCSVVETGLPLASPTQKSTTETR